MSLLDSETVAGTSASSSPNRPAAGGSAAAIQIRGLNKSFSRRQVDGDRALADVDLDVEPGEFLVLLGPSGCGKTTLLRSIAGLERPDSGSIAIDGVPVFDSARKISIDAGRRPTTMIFQSYALWPHMTAARNVAFQLKCAGAPRGEIAPRVKDMLEKVGIGHLGHRYPGEMSGGQQQRLALARALVVDQRVVLFDEPLSNVDAQVREKLRLELIKMQRTLRFTAIYVTHDQSEAMGLADRIAVMAHGRIAQIDTPRELYQHPETIDVARFLGQSNELPFELRSFDPSTGVAFGEGPLGPVRALWEQRDGAAAPAPGARLVAFGRPSSFAIEQGRKAKEAADNVWHGSVEAARFFGTHVEYVVRIGESRLRCWLPADQRGELAEDGVVSISISAQNLQTVTES